MDDRDFFDMMFQGFKDTTHAEDAYWGFEEEPDEDNLYQVFFVQASAPETKTVLGYFDNPADAAFITAIHGAFPDLWRRLHSALDEADEKDGAKDDAERLAADLSLRLSECQRNYARAEVSEDWHGKATGS